MRPGWKQDPIRKSFGHSFIAGRRASRGPIGGARRKRSVAGQRCIRPPLSVASPATLQAFGSRHTPVQILWKTGSARELAQPNRWGEGSRLARAPRPQPIIGPSLEEHDHHIQAGSQERRHSARQRHEDEGLINHDTTPHSQTRHRVIATLHTDFPSTLMVGKRWQYTPGRASLHRICR